MVSHTDIDAQPGATPAPAPSQLAGPAYWNARRAYADTSSRQLGQRWHQLRRWRDEGGLTEATDPDELRAVEAELLARHGGLPW